MITRLRELATSLRDDVSLRRLIKYVGILFTGSVGASLLSLAAIGLTARTLGPELLGVLVMIEAYVRLIDRWLRPESWQTLIKYGAENLTNDRIDNFKKLIKLGFLVDIIGALTAAVVAIAGVQFAAQWFEWDSTTTQMASLYCLSLLFQISGTPIALLRLYDRFAVMAFLDTASAALRLALVAMAWFLSAGIWSFLFISIAIAILTPLVYLAIALRDLNNHGHSDFIRIPVSGVSEAHPGIWRLFWSANFTLLIRKTVENSDVLIVGAILGSAASGALHVVKRLAEVVLKIGRPIQQVLYPDIVRLWAKGEHGRFGSAVRRTNAICGGCAAALTVLFSLNPEFLLTTFVGPDFANAAPSLIVQMIAMTFFMSGIALRPALYSMGSDRAVLVAMFCGSLTFYIVSLSMMPHIGLIAANIGHCAFYGLFVASCWIRFITLMRNGTQPLNQKEERVSTQQS